MEWNVLLAWLLLFTISSTTTSQPVVRVQLVRLELNWIESINNKIINPRGFPIRCLLSLGLSLSGAVAACLSVRHVPYHTIHTVLLIWIPMAGTDRSDVVATFFDWSEFGTIRWHHSIGTVLYRTMEYFFSICRSFFTFYTTINDPHPPAPWRPTRAPFQPSIIISMDLG